MSDEIDLNDEEQETLEEVWRERQAAQAKARKDAESEEAVDADGKD